MRFIAYFCIRQISWVKNAHFNANPRLHVLVFPVLFLGYNLLVVTKVCNFKGVKLLVHLVIKYNCFTLCSYPSVQLT